MKTQSNSSSDHATASFFNLLSSYVVALEKKQTTKPFKHVTKKWVCFIRSYREGMTGSVGKASLGSECRCTFEFKISMGLSADCVRYPPPTKAVKMYYIKMGVK